VSFIVALDLATVKKFEQFSSILQSLYKSKLQDGFKKLTGL